ncbi:hypothetical protein [Shewanella sp. 6_MG-2023]|uniref:hypothetical protein n=1 Tax=Shewanella sp. 6_MG-2023 TaxID=3062660 RepID=UPI0026E41878|nr:hypothetical protein [Shewanella sp. 6_MG-2023]MDO6621200.1 hypothetical protein [Shewanella sp. 6_MG-2023]
MTDPFLKASQGFADDERKAALEHQLEIVNETEAGIIRQLLGVEKKPLSEKQEYIYKNKIEPALAEKCGIKGCGQFVPAGTDYCGSCEIEYG